MGSEVILFQGLLLLSARAAMESASVSPGIVSMEAYKHSKANPWHEAAVLKLRGGRG
jgi:hypothetical protein